MIAQLDLDYIKLRPLKVFPRLVSYALFEGRPLTTSGRWINPLVFSLFNLEKNLPAFKKVSRPVFILGTGRSGTTLLGMLLSMHKSVGFLNEPKALWNSIYRYEDLIGSYTLDKAHYRLNENMLTDKIKKNAHRIYSYYMLASGSKRIVDKYPELIFRTEFVKGIFPDAKFLFLVRNGWDTCASIDNWSKENGKNNENQVEDWWGLNNRKWNSLLHELVFGNSDFNYNEVKKLDDHMNMAALEWTLTMQEGINLIQEENTDIHMVKFEDLTNNREDCLQKILDFCELENDPKFFKYAERIVKPVGAKNKFDLHPSIEIPFLKTMRALGY